MEIGRGRRGAGQRPAAELTDLGRALAGPHRRLRRQLAGEAAAAGTVLPAEQLTAVIAARRVPGASGPARGQELTVSVIPRAQRGLSAAAAWLGRARLAVGLGHGSGDLADRLRAQPARG